MRLNSDQLITLCEIAKKAALSAGKIIADNQGGNVEVNSKDGGENIASCVVTEIDLAAQEAILNILIPTLKEYDLGMLAEESTDNSSRFDKDFFWCIDPLDGTLAFSRDEDGYSTSIALISKDGTPIIGVVYNPRSNSLYNAIKGHGSYKNDKALKVSSKSNFLTLLYDRSYTKHPEYNSQIEKLDQHAKAIGLKGVRLHHLGGAVMNGISTIEMNPAFYYKFPKKAQGGGSLWDFAASSVIQSEAGGFNSDYNRQPIDLNRKDSTFMNHKGIIYVSSKELLKLIP